MVEEGEKRGSSSSDRKQGELGARETRCEREMLFTHTLSLAPSSSQPLQLNSDSSTHNDTNHSKSIITLTLYTVYSLIHSANTILRKIFSSITWSKVYSSKSLYKKSSGIEFKVLKPQKKAKIKSPLFLFVKEKEDHNTVCYYPFDTFIINFWIKIRIWFLVNS